MLRTFIIIQYACADITVYVCEVPDGIDEIECAG